MSVLHVRSSSGIYGAENVLLALLPELARLGAAPRLLCIQNHLMPRQDLFDAAVARGIDAALLPSRGRFDQATLRALSAAIAQSLAHDPDTVIHTHDYKSLFFALLARRGRPIPIIATCHGHIAGGRLQRAYNALELRMMRRASQVLIVSEAMRALLVARGIAPERVTLVENGIDTRRFTPDIAPLERRALGLDAADIVFGSAMRLGPEKNPHGLVAAFDSVHRAQPAAALVIAGDGPLREALQAQVDALGLGDRVRLLGVRDDLPVLYPLFDAFVLPSISEGLPLALLEAMAAAVPVIATRVGHVPVVLDGLPVSVVEPGDTDALAAAMLAQAQRPRGRVPELRARVRSLYSAERMARRHAAMYRGCVARSDAMAIR